MQAWFCSNSQVRNTRCNARLRVARSGRLVRLCSSVRRSCWRLGRGWFDGVLLCDMWLLLAPDPLYDIAVFKIHPPCGTGHTGFDSTIRLLLFGLFGLLERFDVFVCVFFLFCPFCCLLYRFDEYAMLGFITLFRLFARSTHFTCFARLREAVDAQVSTASVAPAVRACTLFAVVCTAASSIPSMAVANGQAVSEGASGLLVGQSAPAADPYALMQQLYTAHKRRDQGTLTRLLPRVRGHVLEPYAAYWELTGRLDDASEREVQVFLHRWQGSYWEDRLRNDWLLQLAERADWEAFLQHEAQFRMQDDRTVRCYALRLGAKEATAQARARRIYDNWLRSSNTDQACLQAAGDAYRKQLLTADEIWYRAALAMQGRRKTAAENAVRLVSPASVTSVAAIYSKPKRFIQRAKAKTNRYLVTLALIRLAQRNHDAVVSHLHGQWGARLGNRQAAWVWAEVGRNAALNGERNAVRYFVRAHNKYLSQQQLAWKARAAMVAGLDKHAAVVIDAFNHMGDDQRAQPRWQYWLARALTAQGKIADAQALFHSTAQRYPLDYYGMLAAEHVGLQAPALPAENATISDADRAWVSSTSGLHRALVAMQNGIRHWGAREWNYHIRLFQPDGASPGQAVAAAELACAHQVWDRCIRSASHALPERSYRQYLYPHAHLSLVTSHSRQHGLPAFFAMGLIRQESLFVTDAHSHAGAGGLMQIMPATARWTAKQIGLEGFNSRDRNEPNTNVLLGTYYFNQVYQDLDQSLPLTLAGYNAGPNRARRWRERGISDATIWNETIPFDETRDYVQKVLANMVVYSQSLPSTREGASNANVSRKQREQTDPAAPKRKQIVTLRSLMGQITPAAHPYAELP